jgi:hypothetical protein
MAKFWEIGKADGTVAEDHHFWLEHTKNSESNDANPDATLPFQR